MPESIKSVFKSINCIRHYYPVRLLGSFERFSPGKGHIRFSTSVASDDGMRNHT